MKYKSADTSDVGYFQSITSFKKIFDRKLNLEHQMVLFIQSWAEIAQKIMHRKEKQKCS